MTPTPEEIEQLRVSGETLSAIAAKAKQADQLANENSRLAAEVEQAHRARNITVQLKLGAQDAIAELRATLERCQDGGKELYRERDAARAELAEARAENGRQAATIAGRRWIGTGYDLPEEGEWVLHTYYGVRSPEYGLFKKGRFMRDGGPESFPATHWLRIPMIERH